jgi:predicted transcriptional regulator
MIAMAAGTAVSAKASYNQGKVAEQVGRNNATMAEYAAQDAQRQGEQDAMAVQRRAAAIKSSQRVNLASKGLDLTYGTAADLQDQTDFFGQSDVLTTRDNARRGMWNARAQGQQALAMGRADAQNANLQATGTMLSGAGQVAGKWYEYKGR